MANEPTPASAFNIDDYLALDTELERDEYLRTHQSAVEAADTGELTNDSKIFFNVSKEGTPSYLGGGKSTFGLEYSKARLLPTTWTQSELRKFVNTGIMRKLPGFEVGMGMPEVVAAWDDLIRSSFAFSQSGKEWTPYDVLNTYSNEDNKFGTVKKGDWEYDVATGERVRYLGPLTKTTTQKAVDLTSAADAKALTTSVLTQALGRAPTQKEFAQYRASINAMERETPTVSTTTTQYKPVLETGELETVSSDTTTSGGVSAEALAASVKEGVKETSEYGKYQAATTYWDAMMQMISGG